MLGVAVLLFGATTVFGELQDALDRIWRAPARTSGGLWRSLRARLLSFGMVLGIGFLLMVSLVARRRPLGARQVVGAAVRRLGGARRRCVNLVLSFALTTVIFAMIYKLMPRVHIALARRLARRGASRRCCSRSASSLIGLYLGRSGFASGFGAAGSLVVLFLWVYYSAQIFLLGAEFTWVYAHALRLAARPGVAAALARPRRDGPGCARALARSARRSAAARPRPRQGRAERAARISSPRLVRREEHGMRIRCDGWTGAAR